MAQQLRKNNDYGLTLVELLFALVIGVIVIGVAFTILVNSMNSYKKIENQQLLQQEANLILTQVRSIHRFQSSYTISYNTTNNLYTIALPSGNSESLGSGQYHIEVLIDRHLITASTPITISSATKQYSLSIKITDPNTNNEFSISTGLTRL